MKSANKKIATVEDLCKVVGCGINTQNEAQEKIKQVLFYLKEWNVIDNFNLDKLDWVFSDTESY